ncbi:MAG: hypothetical protein JXM70_12340 [Pirellulales bacterium]|nr:hypothetical protein [Pirellulales bacterium]
MTLSETAKSDTHGWLDISRTALLVIDMQRGIPRTWRGLGSARGTKDHCERQYDPAGIELPSA